VGFLHLCGYAEIDQFYSVGVLRLEKDVLGLYVTVDYALAVQVYYCS
jgi:hypothetical protein